MTNTKFRKRMLLSSVAMLLVALVALGSATFAWFTSSKTANATGLTFSSTASSGIVVASQTAKNYAGAQGNPWGKTTILNKDSTTGNTGADIAFDPASFSGVNSSSHLAVMRQTKSADPDDADAYNATTPESISTISYDSSGIHTSGIFAEKVYIKATGDPTAVKVSSVSVAQASGSKNAVFGAVNVLIVDDAGKVVYHKNANGNDATGSYLKESASTYTASAVEASRAAVSDPVLTGLASGDNAGKIDSTGTQYVWVIVYLDGQNEAVYTTNVAAESLVDSVNVNFEMVTSGS